MTIEPPLLLVSALFFLALTSLFYLGGWLAVTVILRLSQNRLSQAAVKWLVMLALLLPLLLGAGLTIGGATLRHDHAAAALEHHDAACQELFVRLLAVGSGAIGTPADLTTGLVVNALSWLLLGIGLVFLLRLLRANALLERGLTPYLRAPSPRLGCSLERVGRRLPGIQAERFYECPFPAHYSSVLGLAHARCVLSGDLVTAATDDELDAVVAHEACHLRSGDVLGTLLVGALDCLFFALRPVRLLGRQWREAAELACDDAAVSATQQPLAMASAILRAGGAPVPACRPARPLPTVALAFADQAACAPSKRVQRLIAQAQKTESAPVVESRLHILAGWLLAVALAGMGWTLLLSPQTICYAHCFLETVARLLPF